MNIHGLFFVLYLSMVAITLFLLSLLFQHEKRIKFLEKESDNPKKTLLKKD